MKVIIRGEIAKYFFVFFFLGDNLVFSVNYSLQKFYSPDLTDVYLLSPIFAG